MNPLSRNNPLWKRICVILGSCLLLAALGLTLGNLWEQRQAEQNSAHLLALAQQRLDGENPQPDDDPLNPDPLAGYAIDGILSIPDLGLELPVLADYSEENLRLSICLYRPGERRQPQGDCRSQLPQSLRTACQPGGRRSADLHPGGRHSHPLSGHRDHRDRR